MERVNGCGDRLKLQRNNIKFNDLFKKSMVEPLTNQNSAQVTAPTP